MADNKWIRGWRVWAVVFLGITLLVFAYASFVIRDVIPTVQIVRPIRTALRDYVTCNGKIEPISPHVYRAQFETTVTSTRAKEGRPVRQGQTVLTLDSNEIRAGLAQAKVQLLAAQDDLRNDRAGGPPHDRAHLTGDLRRAEADVKHLRERQDLLEKLLSANAATRDEFNQNATVLAQAQALLDMFQKEQKDLAEQAILSDERDSLRVKQAEEQIELLEKKLRSATVTSEIGGTLYSFPLHENDYVRRGDVLAEIADLRRVQLRAFVDEADLGGLKLGQAVTIRWDAMPERMWTGRTEQIPKQLSARGSRSVGEVLCSVDNGKLELLPNVNVDVRILVDEMDNVLVVPRGAVHTEQGSHFVFVLNRDRLRRRQITLGMANSVNYEVISGLDEGDRVAVSSSLDLHDGAVVHPSEVYHAEKD